MASSEAIAQIKSDEGFLKKAQNIKLQGGGVGSEFSIGFGFNLKKPTAREDLILAGVHPADVGGVISGENEISKEIGDSLVQISLQRAENEARKIFPNFSTVPQNIKDVLVNMSFQLGATSLRTFDKMRAAVKDENWPEMRKEMLDSKWARKDSTNRANRLAKQVNEVKFTPIPAPIPRTALAGQKFLKDAFKADVQDRLATELSGLMADDALVDELAGLAANIPEEGEVVKPKLAKMEQGLFEDEAGKKFFVDADQRLLELDENNQPRAVIDPSKFDLTKVNREPAQISPEEEIF